MIPFLYLSDGSAGLKSPLEEGRPYLLVILALMLLLMGSGFDSPSELGCWFKSTMLFSTGDLFRKFCDPRLLGDDCMLPFVFTWILCFPENVEMGERRGGLQDNRNGLVNENDPLNYKRNQDSRTMAGLRISKQLRKGGFMPSNPSSENHFIAGERSFFSNFIVLEETLPKLRLPVLSLEAINEQGGHAVTRVQVDLAKMIILDRHVAGKKTLISALMVLAVKH